MHPAPAHQPQPTRRLLLAMAAWPLWGLGGADVLAQEPEQAPGQAGYKVSAATLQQAMARRFPLRYPVPGFVDFEVQAPLLRLVPERNHLASDIEVQISGPALRQPRKGVFELEFALRYEPGDQTVRAHQLQVRSLRLPGLPPDSVALLERYLPALARDALAEVVLHRLQPRDLALADVMGLQPGTITVTAQGLTIGFVPKPAV